jgi:alanyl-tRNA synthetase
MTTRLYYTDSMLTRFAAQVVSCKPDADRFQLVLDQTAFYPSSGGQPFDTGRLNQAVVTDVREDDEGRVVHVVDRPLGVGEAVQGAIDWPRRFDHMQQHTGQHILSAAFDHTCGARTTSFHLGAESSTVDLAREVTPAEIAAAELDANRVVWENRPVAVSFVTEEEAAALPLRKDPVRTGKLRLVHVTDFDLSACGGTHVPATGMIGVIAVTGWERFKGASRIAFACGGRALASHASLRDVVTVASRAASVAAQDLPAAIERLQAEIKDAGRLAKRLQEELAGFRAADLRTRAETIGPYRGVLMARPGEQTPDMKQLASTVVETPGFLVLFIGDGRPAPVVLARSADVPIDAGAWVKQAAAEIGGRGGGRPESAQGGLDADPARIIAYARQTLV